LLLKSGFKVWGVKSSKPCNILDTNHVCKELNLLSSKINLDLDQIKPDIMVHTAWITTPGVFWESQDNYKWIRASKKLIEEFSKSGGKYLVITSTCAEYSWDTEIPLNESSKTSPQSRYGKSKLELLNWLNQQQVPFLWARTFFQFGLNEPNGRLVPSLIDSLLAGKEFEVKNPNDIRDFIFIEDVVQVLFNLIVKNHLGIINVGTGLGTSIRFITDLIASELNGITLVKYPDFTKTGGSIVANPEKLISVIGTYPWTRLDEAISKTIAYRMKQSF
jgi:nucleoside-diphosphate-sugar epimerase